MGKRLAAVLAVVLALLPGVALASSTEYVTWSGDTGVGLAYAVRATNRYNAALLALGYEPSEVTSGYREKLSDANYGGKFYTYAQTFEQPNGIDGLPGWYPAYALVNVIAYGTSDLWCSQVSAYDYGQAKADLEKVLNGEDVGGGSGSGGTVAAWSTQYVSSFSTSYVLTDTANVRYTACVNVPSGYTLLPQNINISLTGETPNMTMDNSHYYVANYSTNNLSIVTYSFSADMEIQNGNDSKGNSYPFRWWNKTGSAQKCTIQTYHYNILSVVNNNDGFTIQCVFTDKLNPYDSNISNGSYFQMQLNTSTFRPTGASVSPPSGDWPENPTPTPTPDPPELPSPADPVPDPEPEPDPITADPYVPTLPPLTYPTVTTEPTGTTPADYTPWLRQILAALNNIHTDLATYTNDIVSGLNQVISAINALAQSNINAANKLDSSLKTHCEHLRTNIDSNFSNLKQYLKQLFEWLEDKMEWDAAGYDDSALLRQLRSIEAKLGGGTYRPNPSDNPAAGSPDFFAWLSDLLGGLITALLGLTPEVLGQLTGAFDGLTDLFPISIPWDIMAMLALFAAEPVTPVFDMPVPVGGALADGSMVMSHVDLTDWDGIAAVVRTLELVLFGFAVAQRVPEWLGLARTGDE